MERLVITGGQPLGGHIPIHPAKNAVLPAMCASLLTEEPTHLERVPPLDDVGTLKTILESLGVEISLQDEGMVLQAPATISSHADYDLVRRMRASILVLGPLLSRFGTAKVSLPGGCAIGARPVDQHLKGFLALGADIRMEHGYIRATAPPRGLRGGKVHFDLVTVTGTENLLLAAVLANGTTILSNAAREPEVVDLCRMLVEMGAKIQGIGTDHLEVEGVSDLHGTRHIPMPDRVEAGTYACAVGLAGGDVTLGPVCHGDMEAIYAKLNAAGLELIQEEENLRVRKVGPIQSGDMTTAPHPGFPTDVQAQFMALMTQAEGTSTITERIFENRFMHVSELNRLGADIVVHGPTARVQGPTPLTGATVMASDLRASASLVLAGLAAEGYTIVRRIYHLDRGYTTMEEKLNAVGANVIREVDS